MRPLPLLMLAGLALVACEKKVTVPSGKTGETVTVTSDGNKDSAMTITGTTAGGQSVEAVIGGEGAAWPSDAPFHAPAYPGAKVTAVINSKGSGGAPGGVVTFETSDTPAAVTTFYKAAAERAGLKNGSSVTTGETWMFTSSNDDGQGLLVAASVVDGKTGATLTYGFKGTK